MRPTYGRPVLRGSRSRVSSVRPAIAILLRVCAGCRPGRDPSAILGAWDYGRDNIEFMASGEVRFVSALSERRGSFRQTAPADIQVDLGSVWPSGERRIWYAMVRDEQLGICEIRTGRHCMRFSRPGRSVRDLPR
jgi:hypothetical protein